MMIVERPGKCGIDSNCLQRLPKAGGIRKTTEGGHRSFRRMAWSARPLVDPIERRHRCAKNGRGFVQRAQLISNAPIFASGFRAGDHESVGARQGTERLTQSAQREDGSLCEWIQSVYYNYVQVAPQPAMLKPIIHDKNIRG